MRVLEVLAQRRDGFPLISGHRGAGGYAPENTMAAFAKGLEVGADLLELDVQLTRDGEVVVIHDSTVDRTTDGQGRVGDHTLAEITALDAGSWFAPAFAAERIPTLEQLAAWAAGRIRLNIELKASAETLGDLPEKVVAICERHGITSQTLIISFHHPAIRRVRDTGADLACAINFGQPLPDPVATAAVFGANILNTGNGMLTPQFCAMAHANGLGLQCYMDDPARARELAACGVDFMDADHPDLVRAAVRGMR